MRSWMLRGPALLALIFNVATALAAENDPIDKLRRDAEQGDAAAQFNLGLVYDEGKAVLQDVAEALKWFRRAAEQGNAKAQFNLGLMYYEGRGVPQDYVAAHMFFNLAGARAKNPERVREVQEVRDQLATMMTASQIAEAQRRAREWQTEPRSDGK